MRALAITSFFTLLFSFGMATSILLSNYGTETADSVGAVEVPALPRKCPVVFGFEFTLDGIVTSAGLPNESTIPVGVTQGSVAYRTEMARLYSICEETARTGTLPAEALQYRSEGAPVRWVGDHYHWIGGPVTDLRDVVIEAKHAALETLSQQYGLTDLNVDAPFHALATAPTFIFTAI